MRDLVTDKRQQSGFTLVEVVIVLVVGGILMAVALRSGKSISDSAKMEATKQEMDQTAMAIVGNPELMSNGTRSDFGYVGDVGSLPANLTALVTNPGYGTWRGPYIRNANTQVADDYSKDAWGSSYTYAGGIALQSTGSGSTITRNLANSTTDVLRNSMTGAVTDFDGSAPGWEYMDSITLQLSYPNGSGGVAVRTKHPKEDGFFQFDSLPIGRHTLEMIYEPYDDTTTRLIAVLPGSRTNAELRLPMDVWHNTPLHSGGGGGVLVHVPNSDTARGQANFCDGFLFYVQNPGTSSVTLTNMSISWTSPTAYFTRVRVGSNTAYNRSTPRTGSGGTVNLTRNQVIRPGQTVRVWVDRFRNVATGTGSRVAMNNASFDVHLSDGTTFTVTTGGCM